MLLVDQALLQQAILLGWTSELAIIVKMNDLPKEKQPHSADPDF
ncbi:hypothetical protein [Coxiella burnetii]|nr:hypothetical protein [Coxiella burnetii]PNT90209.1 hypothetical protein C2L89_01220 [Coxiella burnetii]